MKEKFRCLIKQDAERKNVIRELSPCIFEKFNGFNIVRLEFDRKLKQEMSPIDIIYKPVKKETENIECFFLRELTWAIELRSTKTKKLGTEQLFSVISVLITTEEKINLIDISKTAQVGQVTYTILTLRLCQRLRKILNLNTAIPLTAYIDFETTGPTDDCLDPENDHSVLCHNFCFSSASTN